MAKEKANKNNKDNVKANKETNKNKKSFFKSFKTKLKKVVWPTPKQLVNNTAAVIAIVLITALAGAIVGFLPYNFNPAKTFIGDVGANFMGYAIAVISILGVAKTYTAIVIIAPIIVLALPIFDTLWAIVRRIAKTKSLKGVFKADNGHLHHKLMARGYTQKQSVLILYGITATLGMVAIILLDSGIWKAISFALLVIAIVAIGYKDILHLREDEEKEDTEKTINKAKLRKDKE